MPTCKFIQVTFLCILISLTSKSQTKNIYNYQELSHLYYQKQKDSLKKAWSCPTLYKEKATQKVYKEIWDGRTDFFTKAITDDHFVYEQDVFNYVNGIVQQIVKANTKMIPNQPFLVLDRSPSVNAYAIGSGVIAINTGLVAFAASREEIALSIAHELAHNILEHPEISMKKRAEWLSSEEYKNSLNEVLDSKYERLTRLKKVFENYSFDRSKHQRYHESDADSLAIVLLKNSNISFDARFFLRLDSADMQYRQPLKKPVKDYFAAYQFTVEDAWLKKRSKGLSTKTYNFNTTSDLQDSLKTHPDCVERYNKTKAVQSQPMKVVPVPSNIKDQATKMLIWNMYCNMNLAPCLYRILLEKEKGNTDAWYDFMVHNVIMSLFQADKELHRFTSIGVTQKEYISKDYYELQTLLEQIPRENLEHFCKTLQSAGFWSNMPAPEKALKGFLHTLAFDPESSEKSKAKVAKEFIANNNSSLYCEFASSFDK